MSTVLSVRRECSGGPVLSYVEASRDLHGMSRLTLLIHGYNNSQCSASRSYGSFGSLSDVTDPSVVAAFGERCEFYWPGDSRWFGPLSYPAEIEPAKESAKRLGEF